MDRRKLGLLGIIVILALLAWIFVKPAIEARNAPAPENINCAGPATVVGAATKEDCIGANVEVASESASTKPTTSTVPTEDMDIYCPIVQGDKLLGEVYTATYEDCTANREAQGVYVYLDTPSGSTPTPSDPVTDPAK